MSQLAIPVEQETVYIGPPMRVATRVSRMVRAKRSQVIPERKGWLNVALTVVAGCCKVIFDDESLSQELRHGEQLKIPSDIGHTIVAIEDFRAVVSFDLNSSENQT